MKYLLLLLTLAFICLSPARAQSQSNTAKLLEQGVELQERARYRAALKKFDQVLKAEPNNLTAQIEKAFTLLALGDFRQALVLSEYTLQSHPKANELLMAYINKGNALSYLNSLKQAVAAYDEGISRYPTSYLLHLNKGLTLMELGKLQEAQKSFEQAVRLNSSDADSHLAIARLAYSQKQRIPALLAYSRFLILEPEGKRAAQALKRVHELMSQNTQRSGNSLTITLADSLLADSLAAAGPNDFRKQEVALTLASAIKLSQNGKDLPRADQFALRFATLASSLAQDLDNEEGFFWDYYAPFFAEMYQLRLVLPFAYVAHATDRSKYIKEWIAENEMELARFFAWSEIYPFPR